VRDTANFQAESVWLVQQVDVQSGADLGNDVRGDGQRASGAVVQGRPFTAASLGTPPTRQP
jgi:hypothetical protein